ncbi:hypothetical protein [Methylobacterium nodulans]|uniref:Uncharacterized protein n=1 Tax=Methylobacterium nodulans (strain LMG 21967 / CNCM I-2342 / ORS 2060) TaxID=460265 RepID=B8IHP9_METNO|nr:hypothetical protein [Methylobacterium nodulans]ACL61712.1 hypothetical protein Mnod_6970 [Methylobacterium nodulans ORS 2060]
MIWALLHYQRVIATGCLADVLDAAEGDDVIERTFLPGGLREIARILEVPVHALFGAEQEPAAGGEIFTLVTLPGTVQLLRAYEALVPVRRRALLTLIGPAEDAIGEAP